LIAHMPVALVSGASRGVGRGIGVSLGAAGWTVWATGRSSRASGPTSHLPGTVEETAEAVDAPGRRRFNGRVLDVDVLAGEYGVEVG
jgi:NAD(P)-dependent dehydrogenase (short-subunit alcohol dehydrogenase family)